MSLATAPWNVKRRTGTNIIGLNVAPWSFNTRAGVAKTGSAFETQVREGVAVGFLQSSSGIDGSISQPMTLLPGNYQVSLRASQRTCCGVADITLYDQELYLLVDGVCLGTIQPPGNSSNSYPTLTSEPFQVSRTSRVL